MNCRFCEAAIHLGHHNDDELQSLQLCFTCCFWWEKIKWRVNGDIYEGNRVARIHGKHYVIYPDTEVGFQGFGGKNHVVQFDSGEVVITCNLWFQGEIPLRFREHLPNNATFVDTRLTCKCRAKFEPITETQTKCLTCVLSRKPQRW